MNLLSREANNSRQAMGNESGEGEGEENQERGGDKEPEDQDNDVDEEDVVDESDGTVDREAKVADNEQPQQAIKTKAKAMLTCSKCKKRQSRRGCSQLACITCCTDETSCPVHKEIRDKLLWKQQILEGTTFVNHMAQETRMRKLQPKQFRESGFSYLGDTVLIWSLRDFEKNAAWKEEAIRKSERRRRYQQRPQQSAAVCVDTTAAITTVTLCNASNTPTAAAATVAAAASNNSRNIMSSSNDWESTRRNDLLNRKKRKFYQIMETLHQQSMR